MSCRWRSAWKGLNKALRRWKLTRRGGAGQVAVAAGLQHLRDQEGVGLGFGKGCGERRFSVESCVASHNIVTELAALILEFEIGIWILNTTHWTGSLCKNGVGNWKAAGETKLVRCIQ